ncbi:MAG: DUF1926 domain-containing protein [Dehalococcoidia bacterium]|nr:DUF1926 domain-containing protein [Dehalococcoidia bacterium]
MTRKSLYLGLAIHNHQPVGNDPTIFAWAYDRSYLPLVELLEKHPAIRVSLHYSGPLLDWIMENRPLFLDRLAALADRGQVEIMGGGYYEPILPSIPPADRIGQIEKMSAFVRERFGRQPSGIWLAERVWEPDLPTSLAKAGVEWTVVDDTHFRLAGLEEKGLFGYYLTEDQGNILKIFPTSKYLRYAIPWHEVTAVMDYLMDVAKEGVNLAVLGDDGEKFGLWPGTYAHCWEKGWVEDFFTALERNQDWLHTIPLGDYSRSYPPLGRVYLPTASYDEMLEWALPAGRSSQLARLKHRLAGEGQAEVLGFLGGGFWRNFLVKYPEVNNMHKKMLRVHRQVYGTPDAGRGRAGIEELWKGQCNCPYWHGVFGGIYLNGIRAETYSHLIEAQNQVDVVLQRTGPYLTWEMSDLDCDGRDELLIEGTIFNLYLAPAQGGSLFEWDLRRPPFNLTSTLSSRPEAYHQELLAPPEEIVPEGDGVQTIHTGLRVKEPGLAKRIHFDTYRRVCLIDHFLKPNPTAANLRSAKYEEMGDFAMGAYQAQVTGLTGGLCVTLVRDGHLTYGQKPTPFRVEKRLEVLEGQPRYTVRYELTNTAQTRVSGAFASEWSLHLLGGGGDPQGFWEAGARHGRLDSSSHVQNIDRLAIGNHRLGIHLFMRASRNMALFQFPLEAVSNSEGGLERTFQGTCFMLLAPFTLEPGGSLAFALEWECSGLGE